MNVKTIREACFYEARNNLKGSAKTALEDFAVAATDAELIRFAQLINNLDQPHDWWTPTDATDLARANVD